MRNEQVMMDLILTTAINDERILAVYMNGSRVNEKVKKDIFQDYDIVYVTKDMNSFIEDRNWIDVFGKRLYMQMPEENDYMRGYPIDINENYGYLIQLDDGNRLDLHIQSVEYAKKAILEDKLCEILIDKEGILPDIMKATDEDYYVKKPTEADYFCCCNEFYWITNNVAKGLWREEITYVFDMIHGYLRPQLIQMIAWNIAKDHHFKCSIGKSGKFLQQLMNPYDWEQLLMTYCDSQVNHIYESVVLMSELFSANAKKVAESFDFIYDENEAKSSINYMKYVFKLSKDAEEIL